MLGQGISIDGIMNEYKGLKKVEILAYLQCAKVILEKLLAYVYLFINRS